MKVNIILFGQLTDITGADNFILEDVADSDGVVAALSQSCPALVNSKYVIAVDKNVISTNTLLTDNCTVALLPPFSGG